uniref:Ankyrin repeat protein n=1 Tax=Pithovirus LCPAC102 TaxID=2506587 RepID=A0A481Z661_9VIRU|nr:MAG: hypothetical protein LCPAC102_00500 [Pithovirus LCPAC102]
MYNITLKSDNNEDVTYNFISRSFPRESLMTILQSMQNEYASQDELVETITITNDEFNKVKDIFISNGKYTKDQIELYTKYKLNPYSYILAIKYEDYIRDKMYNIEYIDHPMNTYKYYDLIKLDKKIIKKINHNRRYNYKNIKNSSNILFKPNNEYNTDINMMKSINIQINKIKYIFVEKYKNNILVAGGYVYSMLYNTYSPDIDIFIHSCDYITAEKIIKSIFINIAKIMKMNIYIIRTKNAITLKCNIYNIEFQIILRLYGSPSEILHGFDVDSCCLGCDGNDIWMTKKAYYALTHGYNTVDFNRLSPSYESRLCKYGSRNMSIRIPKFHINKINLLELTKFTNEWGKYKNKYIRLNGIDKLLILNHKWIESNRYNKSMSFINKINEETSDYNDPKCNYIFKVGNIFKYLLIYYDKNPTKARYGKYIDLIKKYNTTWNDKYGNLNVKLNGLKYTKHFYFLKLSCSYKNIKNALNFILHIPNNVYTLFSCIKKWQFTKDVEFKITNPGEQMTNTFHSIVLDDNTTWYTGKFYDSIKYMNEYDSDNNSDNDSDNDNDNDSDNDNDILKIKKYVITK